MKASSRDGKRTKKNKKKTVSSYTTIRSLFPPFCGSRYEPQSQIACLTWAEFYVGRVLVIGGANPPRETSFSFAIPDANQFPFITPFNIAQTRNLYETPGYFAAMLYPLQESCPSSRVPSLGTGRSGWKGSRVITLLRPQTRPPSLTLALAFRACPAQAWGSDGRWTLDQGGTDFGLVRHQTCILTSLMSHYLASAGRHIIINPKPKNITPSPPGCHCMLSIGPVVYSIHKKNHHCQVVDWRNGRLLSQELILHVRWDSNHCRVSRRSGFWYYKSSIFTTAPGALISVDAHSLIMYVKFSISCQSSSRLQ